MGDFAYNEVLDLWIANRKFLSYDIEVRLYCDKKDDFQQLAENAVSDIAAHWESVKAAIIAELLPQHLDHASKEITGDEFFSQLTMQTIDLDAVDIMYTIIFADGGLFGGHGIQVLWDPEEEFSADVSLVG
ncbi:MAG: DUF2262 domain-containing protein [Planctomycetaceae bacterium]|nr:DUF2262 domain-containing protein [Planctomycetaceae bacterium]